MKVASVDDTTASSATLTQTSIRYRVSSAVLAFFTWGGWAYAVNACSAETHNAQPIVSAVIHGSISCLITLFMLQTVTKLFHRLRFHPLRMILPAAITTTFTMTCATVVHLMIGTADVPMTVLPGGVVAFCFNLLTTSKLRAQADG